MRRAETEQAIYIANRLKNLGKELQGYGMIGHGGTIIAYSNDLLELLGEKE